jgi:prophage regulatory protein
MSTILRQDAVCMRLGISGTTLFRWVRAQNFPKPIRLGPNTVGWLEADVESWLETKKIATSGGV